jgi:hypothetical protein
MSRASPGRFRDPDGRGPRLVTGTVVLDRLGASGLPLDSGGALTVLLHELGHLVGLGHVEDEDDIMHATSGRHTPEYTPGARRGLHALGSGPCFS